MIQKVSKIFKENWLEIKTSLRKKRVKKDQNSELTFEDIIAIAVVIAFISLFVWAVDSFGKESVIIVSVLVVLVYYIIKFSPILIKIAFWCGIIAIIINFPLPSIAILLLLIFLK